MTHEVRTDAGHPPRTQLQWGPLTAEEAALDELGALTAGEVAQLLRRSGCRGPKSNAADVLCRYLRSRLKAKAVVIVNGWTLHVDGRSHLMPQSVRQFLRRLDAGEWPELVEPPAPKRGAP